MRRKIQEEPSKKVKKDLVEFLSQGSHSDPGINQIIEKEIQAAFTEDEDLLNFAAEALSLSPQDAKHLDDSIPKKATTQRPSI